MLNDTKRLQNLLPPLAKAISQDVYDDLQDATISNESRSSLALAAGLREAADGDALTWMVERHSENSQRASDLAKLIGFADARVRKSIAFILSRLPDESSLIAMSIGCRAVSRSRRINGIFRHAIAYAQTI